MDGLVTSFDKWHHIYIYFYIIHYSSALSAPHSMFCLLGLFDLTKRSESPLYWLKDLRCLFRTVLHVPRPHHVMQPPRPLAPEILHMLRPHHVMQPPRPLAPEILHVPSPHHVMQPQRPLAPEFLHVLLPLFYLTLVRFAEQQQLLNLILLPNSMSFSDAARPLPSFKKCVSHKEILGSADSFC